MLRFDHLVIAVRDLDAASARFRDELGFDVRPGGRHTGFGTHNAIVRFGLDYLELIAVDEPELARRTSRGALVRFLDQWEMGMCAYALATDDLDELARRARDAGIEMAGPLPMHRRRPDGSELSWRLLVPEGDPYFKPWPFFIQWDQSDHARLHTEAPSVHANGALGVTTIQIAVEDLGAASRWYAAMGVQLDGGAASLPVKISPSETAGHQGPVLIEVSTDKAEADVSLSRTPGPQTIRLSRTRRTT